MEASPGISAEPGVARPSPLPAPEGEGYELVIEPSSGWIRIPWQDLWAYRDLLVLLVRRDFLSKYKQTLLGPAWFILQPVLTTIMFAIVFGRVAHISTDDIPGPLFYLCGLLAWNYFSQNVTAGATTFTANAHLFGKVYFPRVILPAAAIVSNLFAFALQLIPFVVVFVYYKFFTPAGSTFGLDWRIVLLPLSLLEASLFSLGVSLWMSASTAKYRDLVHLNQFIVQLWMFATPVIYPLSRIPPHYAWLAWLNPMAAVVESFRITLLGRGTLSIGCLIVSVVLTLVVTASGIVIFQRMERTAVDHL
jgi:lipopolysaccharide transport system permease protein